MMKDEPRPPPIPPPTAPELTETTGQSVPQVAVQAPVKPAGFRGCCTYPHGKLAPQAVQTLSLLAFPFSMAALLTCNFMRVEYVPSQSSSNYLAYTEIGFLSWTDKSGAIDRCEDYRNQDLFDNERSKAAKTFSILGASFGCVAVVVVCFVFPFMAIERKYINLIALSFLLLALFEGLSVFFLGADEVCDDECSVSAGAACAMVAMALLLGAAEITRRIRPYQEMDEEVAAEITRRIRPYQEMDEEVIMDNDSPPSHMMTAPMEQARAAAAARTTTTTTTTEPVAITVAEPIQQEVIVKETYAPDGTRTVERIVKYTNGSQTKETTTTTAENV